MSTPIPQNCTWVDGMSPDDWTAATDPVPARRELTDMEKRRLAALMELRRRQRIAPADSVSGVDRDFEEMGA